METVIGFVVGYLVGAREGKGGLERLKTSVQAILASPEAHRLIGEAMQVAEPVARRASSVGLSSIGGIGGSVMKELVNRAAGTRENTRAA
ncbi:MAG TPA: hypothetical protein VGM53_19890 [Streptosporangiaceae bacterium]|jgi:hypothetical protein